MKADKLQKILANFGIASRRKSEVLIEQGKVSVNGQIATLGDRALRTDKIRVDGKMLLTKVHQKTRVIIYHKPEGEICARSEDKDNNTVFDNLPRMHHGRWVSVGRLDVNTSGLLMFTNHGGLANKLMHPSGNLEREYAVRVIGDVTDDKIKAMRQGVPLEDGFAKFERIKDAGGTGANHWYHVILKEGRYREVRRLWESQRITVNRLIRIRFGHVILPPGLKSGKWIEMSEADVKKL